MPIVAPVVRPYRNLAGRLVRSAFGTTPTALRFGSLTTDSVTCGNGLNKVFDNMAGVNLALCLRPPPPPPGAEKLGQTNTPANPRSWGVVQNHTLGELRIKTP